MNRGLEKNNEGERLTKQETKKSGEISETHSGFGKGRPQERVWGRGPQPPEAKGEPQASNRFLGFLQKHSF